MVGIRSPSSMCFLLVPSALWSFSFFLVFFLISQIVLFCFFLPLWLISAEVHFLSFLNAPALHRCHGAGLLSPEQSTLVCGLCGAALSSCGLNGATWDPGLTAAIKSGLFTLLPWDSFFQGLQTVQPPFQRPCSEILLCLRFPGWEVPGWLPTASRPSSLFRPP